jgi:parallel beta-helix repeat protein
MDGMSCWFDNEDTVEGNTFSGNLREGMAVLGGSTTTVRRNIITRSPVALVSGKIGGDNSSRDPDPKLENNLVWDCAKDRTHVGQDQALDATAVSLREDPRFQDAAANDYSLKPGSPAETAGIGAARMIAFVSPWPLTKAEMQIIPDGDSRSFERWKKPGHEAEAAKKAAEDSLTEARKAADTLVQEALQIDSVERRDAAIEAMRRAIAGSDEKEALTGLMALSRSCAAEFDKAPFRPLVRKWMLSGGTAHRQAALSALHGLGAEAADLDALLTLAENKATPDRKSLVSWLLWIGKYDLTGRAGAVVADLLQSESESDRRDVLNAIWGGSFSPDLEKRVLELSGASGSSAHYDTVYYALSPQANKSAASVERLLEIMGGLGDSHRAHWGLGQGVSAEVAPGLCRGVIALFGKTTDPELRHRCLGLLKTYAGSDELAFLDSLLAKPALTRAMRKDIGEAKQKIAERGGRYGSTLPQRN